MNEFGMGLATGLAIGFGVLCIAMRMNKTPDKEREEAESPIVCVDCTSCEYCAEDRVHEKLNTDKTVTPSRVKARYCTFQYGGHFELTDLVPCQKYKQRGNLLPPKLHITPCPIKPPKEER